VENHSLAWNISSGTSAHVCQSLRIEACKEADLTPSQDTKEKPFHCACGKSFSRNDLLKRHRLREHDTVPQNEDATPSGSSSRTTVPRSPTNVAEPTSNRAKTLEQTDEMPLPLGSMDSATGVTVGATGGQDMYPIPNVFEEFTMFIEDAGLHPSWDRMDLSMFNPTAGQSDPTTVSAPIASATDTADLIDDDFAGLTPHETHKKQHQSRYRKASTYTWRISEVERQELSRKIAEASYPPCPIIQLPSKQALTRYFQSYADSFHKHFPMLHMPTYKITEASPELTLAIAAVGAQYRFEFPNGLELYRKARHMTMGRINRCQNHTLIPDGAVTGIAGNCGATDNICTIILLMAFALWREDVDLLSEGLHLQAPLAHALRQGGLSESHGFYDKTADDWYQWIREERARRTKLIGFAYLNLQAITYNTPPLLLANEIDLLLPCSSVEWETTDPELWEILTQGWVPEEPFQVGLQNLLAGKKEFSVSVEASPLSLFILLQALLQNIMSARHLQLPGDPSLHASSLDLVEYVDNRKRAYILVLIAVLDPHSITGKACGNAPPAPHSTLKTRMVLYRSLRWLSLLWLSSVCTSTSDRIARWKAENRTSWRPI
jgi:hypothetical protein